MNNDPSQIVDGILEDANREAESIIREAERGIAERDQATAERIAEIQNAADTRATSAERAMQTEAKSAVASEERRHNLTLRDALIGECLKRVTAAFAELIQSERYAEILKGWIVEGAIGLGTREVVINCGASERKILEKILPAAEEKIQDLLDYAVTITITSDPPLGDQGVILASVDGRTIFDNRVRTRIERYESEIRLLVHKELFAK